MEEIIFLIEDADEGGFTAKALGHTIFTEAEKLDELKVNIIEAVQCHFDDDVKRLIRTHYVKDEVFAV
jgi:hypothetical protein